MGSVWLGAGGLRVLAHAGSPACMPLSNDEPPLEPFGADSARDLDTPDAAHSWKWRIWHYVTLPLRWRSISYPAMFALGFACSVAFGWIQSEKLPEPVRQRARFASNTMAKALDEILSSDTMEGLLNTTAKLRNVFDNQAASVSGHLSNASTSFKELLPSGNFGIKELFGTWQVPTVSQVLGQSERIGVRKAREGFVARSPVVMIPGIITTGLEVWDGEDCIRSYFRQRIWGTTTMFQSLLSDPDCWARHLALNGTTGLDPLQRPHFNRSIRVRPAQGFESADFFVGGYWLWGLMIEALADIGYDYNSMHLASYDWRLSFQDMERRDRYFTRLRQHIETLVSMSKHKAVVVAHSMGGNVWHYFMQWVTHRVHQNWVNDHIDTEVLISSPLLGTPKAFFSLLTGDNRDFASMGRFSAVVNHFFGHKTRREMWRTCSSLSLIMPMGSDDIWGEAMSGMPLVRLQGRNLTMEEAYNLLAAEGNVPEDLQRITPWLIDGLRRSRPMELDRSATSAEPPEHVWANPLAVPLPFAPNMRKYAFYGIGVPTELSGELEEVSGGQGQPQYLIKKDATKDAGFYLANGDYSCPTQSLGLLCVKGWKNDRRNPARIPCQVREYQDKPTTLLSTGSIRGGSASGDHIDLLGNEEMLSDVITIVTGGDVQERILSDIKEFADRWKDN